MEQNKEAYQAPVDSSQLLVTNPWDTKQKDMNVGKGL